MQLLGADPFLLNMALGGFAGTVSNMVVFPIDLAKTKMQQASSDDERRIFATAWGSLAHIATEDGLLGLWQGSAPVLFGSAPESALQLACHTALVASAITATGAGIEGDLTLGTQMVIGALSGAATIAASNPMEMLRIKSSVSQGSVLTNIKALGLSGLFAGSAATLSRDIPFSAIYFPLYCHLKLSLAPLLEGMHAEGAACAVAGLVAGMTSAFLTVPLDVTKTRVQTQLTQQLLPLSSPAVALKPTAAFVAAFDAADTIGEEAGGLRGNSLQLSVGATARRIVEKEGWSALGAGWQPRTARLAPGMAITLVVYENLQAFVHHL